MKHYKLTLLLFCLSSNIVSSEAEGSDAEGEEPQHQDMALAAVGTMSPAVSDSSNTSSSGPETGNEDDDSMGSGSPLATGLRRRRRKSDSSRRPSVVTFGKMGMTRRASGPGLDALLLEGGEDFSAFAGENSPTGNGVATIRLGDKVALVGTPEQMQQLLGGAQQPAPEQPTPVVVTQPKATNTPPQRNNWDEAQKCCEKTCDSCLRYVGVAFLAVCTDRFLTHLAMQRSYCGGGYS